MANIAKRYAIGFIEGLEKNKLQELLSKRETFEHFLDNQEFKKALENPFLSPEIKVDLLVKCLDICDEQTKHALMIMAQSKRLILLESVLKEIETLLNADRKQCNAILFSQEKIDPSILKIFKESLESKLGYQVGVKEVFWDKQEIKCCIEELDLEISFSKKKFDRDLKNFILVSFLQGAQIES